MSNSDIGREQAAVATLRALGARRAHLLLPQPAAVNEQTGLGVAVPVVNEIELEPMLLQTDVNGSALLAITTSRTVKRALMNAGAPPDEMSVEKAMLRIGEKQYRILRVTVKHCGGTGLIWEMEIEA